MTTRIVHIVEDEPAIRRSAQMMLRVMGYEAQTHESGTAFLDSLPELATGCVLLDIRMPGIDGLEVQRRLNASGGNLPVIVMTGHGDFSVAVAAMQDGAIAFLEKPFSRAALEEALELAFRQLEDPASYREYQRAAAHSIEKLEPTDRDALDLMIRGLDAAESARQAGVPQAAVEASRARIQERLGVASKAEVLRLAFAAAGSPMD